MNNPLLVRVKMREKANVRHLQFLKPLLRAYTLGYLSSTTPRIIALLAALLRREKDVHEAIGKFRLIVRQAAAINRFPAFCAVLVGGTTLLRPPFQVLLRAFSQLLYWKRWRLNPELAELVARSLAAFIAATASFLLLNSGGDSQPISGASSAATESASAAIDPQKTSSEDLVRRYEALASEKPTVTSSTPSSIATQLLHPTQIPPLAGKSLDLTLFTTIHALDTLLTLIVPSTTSPTISPPHSSPRRRLHKLLHALRTLTPPLLFTLSTTTIMRAYFYSPPRLPSPYRAWIARAARLDPRLLAALRAARYGDFVYGKDTGMAPLLGDLCEELGLPREWGDPARTVPVPCRVVHLAGGGGRVCEAHAATRLLRGVRFAAGVYTPVQAVVIARQLLGLWGRSGVQVTTKAELRRVMRQALVSAARSTLFLATFIALFHYGVCLSRTRLGPLLFPRHIVTPRMWDGGLCISGGCALSGVSWWVEAPARRMEVLLFVMPRAFGVWFPRRYERKKMWREGAAFAGAWGVLVAVVGTGRRGAVRGWVGRVLEGLLEGS